MRRVYAWKRVIASVVLTGLAALSADGRETSKPSDDGYTALSKGDWKMALAEFDKAIRAEPRNAECYYNRAQAYRVKGDVDLAIADLTTAIEIAPTFAAAYGNRGALYILKGNYDSVIADCNEAVRRGLKDSWVYNNRGYAYFCKGDVGKAIADLNEAIRIDPQFGRAYANRGLVWCSERLYDRAIADLNEAVRINNKNAAALGLRAGAYLCKGDFAKAMADVNEAIHIEPRWPDAYIRRATIHSFKREYRQAVEGFAEAIRLAPGNATAYAGRGNCLRWQGEYNGAMADFNNAIACNPQSPCPYEIRGVLWIYQGDYERGMADIRTAIRLNPSDPAVTFENWPQKVLSPADYQHGKRQLQQMLHDRPAMTKYGEKDAAVLYEWSTRKFAGQDFGRRIYWDSSVPQEFATSCNYLLSIEGPGFIQVAGTCNKGRGNAADRSFEELWRDTVFELYNVVNEKDFWQLAAEASAERLSKEEFVVRVINCESRAAEKMRAFYIHVFMPWAKQHHLITHPESWGLARRLDPKDNLLQSVTESEPYWRFYARRYDRIILDSLSRKGDYQKALDLATETRKQAETAEERAAICRYSGHCLLRLNKPLPAVNDYNVIIRFNPEDVYAYLGRAAAYGMLHDTGRAMADYAEAIRLDTQNAEAYYCRAAAYKEMGDLDKAVSDYSEAIRLAPKLAKAYYARALVYQQIGDTNKAEADFAQAKKLGYKEK